MARAHTIGRTASNGDQVWIIGTPHFLEAWSENRYGKSRSVSLQEQLGSWTYPPKVGFYESMMDAPIDQTFYAVVRKRRELELISATPPIRGQTEGINLETYHDHADTEEWGSLIWGY